MDGDRRNRSRFIQEITRHAQRDTASCVSRYDAKNQYLWASPAKKVRNSALVLDFRLFFWSVNETNH